MAVTMKAPAPAGLSNKARELMEEINAEAGKHNVWVRTCLLYTSDAADE